HPYLNFPGTTEEAFNFYASALGVEISSMTRFADFPGNMGVQEADMQKIANIALPLGNGSMLMGTDVVGGWQPLNVGNNTYITLEVDSAHEAQRIFDGLSAGGTAQMPLEKTEWAEKYGSL